MGRTTETPAFRFSQRKTQLLAARRKRESISYQKFKLVVTDGPDRGREFLVDRDKIRVGSAPDNDMVIEEETVSRYHFEIEATETGHRLRDLDSTNGTLLDNTWVVDAYLHPGAHVGVGTVSLLFQPLEERVEIPLSPQLSFGGLLGASTKMRAMFYLAERLARRESTTVLITGETGTGKGLLAEAIHDASSRKDKPFVVVDCSTIPAALMESELFGHVKGAFTGAVTTTTGAFEQANGGTIFLDEIGELPLPMQSKLLRVLQDREVKPVGTAQTRQVDVRFMAASNRNLKAEVDAGRFREDLFFRLNVVEIHVPPLRERQEDIAFLARNFLRQFTKDPERRLDDDAVALLNRHDWPGNVRELRNVMERVASLVDNKVIQSADLLSVSASQMGAPPASFRGPWARLPMFKAKEMFEAEYLKEVLALNQHNVSAAARAAGIHRQSFHRLLKKHSVSSRGEEQSSGKPDRPVRVELR